MFSLLSKDSSLYILDKTAKPKLRIGKVIEAKTNPQFYGLSNQEIDITASTEDEKYEFKKIPSNISIVSPAAGIIIADNINDMLKECESMFTNSRQVLDSMEYHKNVMDSEDEIMSLLNPKYAKELEQENKLNTLEKKVNSMEKGIDDIKNLLTQYMNKK